MYHPQDFQEYSYTTNSLDPLEVPEKLNSSNAAQTKLPLRDDAQTPQLDKL